MHESAVLSVRLADKKGLWNVGIKNGKISLVVPNEESITAKEIINGKGLLLLPGIIDAHVHTRDPGYTHKEDFKSATLAAANGGITTIMAMPNTNPPATNKAAIQNAHKSLTSKSLIDAYQVGGLCSDVPSWNESMVHEGVIALDVFDNIFAYGTKNWIKIFTILKKTNIPLCFYLMDSAFEQLRKQIASESGLSEIEQIVHATDGSTEAISIARIFPIAAYFDVPVVIRLLSTAKGLNMVRMMRSLYPTARVYVEVCVHYLFLTSDNLRKDGSSAHIHPPLRTQEDLEELWTGLQDGTVDYIASDHAPHAIYEKNKESLSTSASGMIGLETMLPLLLDACSKNKIGIGDIQRLCCENPARIYGLSGTKGRITEGLEADLVLVDDKKQWVVNSKEFYSKGVKNPFEGWNLTGKPYITIYKGKKIAEDGIVISV